MTSFGFLPLWYHKSPDPIDGFSEPDVGMLMVEAISRYPASWKITHVTQITGREIEWKYLLLSSIPTLLKTKLQAACMLCLGEWDSWNNEDCFNLLLQENNLQNQQDLFKFLPLMTLAWDWKLREINLMRNKTFQHRNTSTYLYWKCFHLSRITQGEKQMDGQPQTIHWPQEGKKYHFNLSRYIKYLIWIKAFKIHQMSSRSSGERQRKGRFILVQNILKFMDSFHNMHFSFNFLKNYLCMDFLWQNKFAFKFYFSCTFWNTLLYILGFRKILRHLFQNKPKVETRS